jgi:hypothetical protein
MVETKAKLIEKICILYNIHRSKKNKKIIKYVVRVYLYIS